MRRLLIVVPLLVLSAFAAPAFAGGWATVGMSSTPAGIEPGTPWTVDMTILQHGRTPLEGVHPTLTIVDGDTRRTFDAKATGDPGTYRVTVTFPTAGRWSYQVDDGFVTGTPHTFAPVEILDAGPTNAADDGGPSPALLVPGIALLAAAAALLMVSRLRHRDRRGPQVA